MVEEAVRYASSGWPVFPLLGKVPFKDSNGFQDATTNEEQIRAWWTKRPLANIGLATGNVSGVIVIDIDPRHQGHRGLKELEKRYGQLPPTRTARTGLSPTLSEPACFDT